MRKPEIITHHGQQILYADFSNLLNKDEIIHLEDAMSDLIRTYPLGTALTLTNMENMFFNKELRTYFEGKVKLNGPHVKSGAVIGMSGLISIMYNAFVTVTGRNIKACRSMNDALIHLTSNN